ncbi:MAG TPA: prohibitin family protein [Aggregatilineales bacterium]|nr:prohibitin family protein [Anaerolineales bacterium]HRE49001.1 prohibitin family protein [Aggregatilineales bacterium]
MSVSSLLSFVALGGLVLLLAGAGIAVSNMSQNKSGRGGWALAGIGAVIAALGFIASSGVVIVGATQVAVVFQSVGGDPANGNLWEVPLGPGLHIIPPVINEPIIYDTSVQNYTMSHISNEGQRSGDGAVQARTRDGQQVDIDVSVLYSIDPALANIVHRKFQNRYQDALIRPTIRSAVREKIASYSVNDLYGTTGIDVAGVPSKLPEAQAQLEEQLSRIFMDNGLRLQDFLIREITFSEEFIRAVEAKVVAEQQAEQAKQEAIRVRTIAEGEADAAETRARGAANAVIEKARGDAESIRVNAKAEAEALALINEQLSKNPILVQWRYIEKLSPNVSLVLLPSNSPFLFDLETLRNTVGTGGN